VAGRRVDPEAVDPLGLTGALEHGRRPPAPDPADKERPAGVLPHGGQVPGGQPAGQRLEQPRGRQRPGRRQPRGPFHLGGHRQRHLGPRRVVDQRPLDIAETAPQRPRERRTRHARVEPEEAEQPLLAGTGGLAGQPHHRPAAEQPMTVAVGEHRVERGITTGFGAWWEQRSGEQQRLLQARGHL
jgi:hypothetical protein